MGSGAPCESRSRHAATTGAHSSRLSLQHTEIKPPYIDTPHFNFSKFKPSCLSFQNPVSPFPQGTCLLLVSNTCAALDGNYRQFMHQCQGTQLAIRAPNAGATVITQGFHPLDALFQEPAAASLPVAH